MIHYALVFLLLLSGAGELYVCKFYDSEEGKDERGVEIRYKTINFVFNILAFEVVLVVVLGMSEVIMPEQLIDILLYCVVSLGIFKAGYTYRLKRF
jgi:hypothetical protein